MKISLLEKRENFVEILKNTLKQNSSSDRLCKYYVNRRINTISTSSLSRDYFKPINREFSNSKSVISSAVYRIYVFLATTPYLRVFLASYSINLSSDYKNVLILGGNHRIRIIDYNNFLTTVILKVGENHRYIQNDLDLRKRLQPRYAPFIKSYTDTSITEELTVGIPINRIKKLNGLEDLVNEHLNAMNKISYRCSLSSYIEKLTTRLNETGLLLKPKTRLKVEQVWTRCTAQVCEVIGLSNIEMTLSHGDFQMANILRKEDGDLVVIDWESSRDRIKDYDLFTLKSKVREYDNLCHESQTLYSKYKGCIYPMALYVLEDMIFVLEENTSNNFCDTLEKYFSHGRIILEHV